MEKIKVSFKKNSYMSNKIGRGQFIFDESIDLIVYGCVCGCGLQKVMNYPSISKYITSENPLTIDFQFTNKKCNIKYRITDGECVIEELEKIVPELTNTDQIFIIKVKDYTTEILCRYNSEEKYFYVQRGDGTTYNYSEDRVIFKKLIK